MSAQSELDRRLGELKVIDRGAEYYAVELLADDNLRVTFGTQTVWVGWADKEKRQEMRKARLVYANRFAELWTELGFSYCVVNTVDDLGLFMIGGGNALVERNLAERVFYEQLGADAAVSVGYTGYESITSLPKTAFRYAPSPKLRMEILNRDQRRCRICGRGPHNNVDIELHLHHIRPWAKGGTTDPRNLVTLCHTCHKGLEPHEDFSLFGHTSRIADHVEAYKKGVANYRKAGVLGPDVSLPT